jgi:hypothetical protein
MWVLLVRLLGGAGDGVGGCGRVRALALLG